MKTPTRTEKKNFCIAMVAIVKKDVSLCETISPISVTYPYKSTDDKEGCIIWVAQAKRDVSLCEKITMNPQFKNICIENFDKAEEVPSYSGDLIINMTISENATRDGRIDFGEISSSIQGV